MRPIRTVMATVLVASVASLTYARQPVRDAAHMSATLMTDPAIESIALQEKPKPHETPETKPPRPEKQEIPREQQKVEKADKKKDQSLKTDQKQDKKQAKQEQKEVKNGGGKGPVSDKDIKAHFGQEHRFSARQVVTTTRIVPNQTRFVYVGYTFVFVDPWPFGWGFDDDCYVDYLDGGWYFFDVMHPGVRVALTIVG